METRYFIRKYNRRGQTETIIFLRRLSESLKAKIMTVGSPRLFIFKAFRGKELQKINLAMHIGNKIYEEVKRQGKTTVWLAKELSCDRTNVYRIYEKSSIDLSLLMRISNILKFNFFELLSEEYDNTLNKKQE